MPVSLPEVGGAGRDVQHANGVRLCGPLGEREEPMSSRPSRARLRGRYPTGHRRYFRRRVRTGPQPTPPLRWRQGPNRVSWCRSSSFHQRAAAWCVHGQWGQKSSQPLSSSQHGGPTFGPPRSDARDSAGRNGLGAKFRNLRYGKPSIAVGKVMCPNDFEYRPPNRKSIRPGGTMQQVRYVITPLALGAGIGRRGNRFG